MSEIRANKVSFDPNHLVLAAGATSANETLMFCLANQGEAFLLPTPYYPGYVLVFLYSTSQILWIACCAGLSILAGVLFYLLNIQLLILVTCISCRFDRDLKWRTGVEIVPIHCTSSNGFQITESALQEAYQEAQKRNLRVKGVLVTNPSNPLGTTMTRNELNMLVSFVDEKGIHLVSDEIYSGTAFSTPSFVSVMEILKERKCDENGSQVWNRVHVVYSLSKDLGLPGFRVGAIYSNDDMVVAAATKMSSFGLVSSQTQYLLAAMLSDKKLTKNYISENHKRLRQRQKKLVSGLQKAGISCLKGNAGLFCWVDMRHLLRSNTFEAEMELWKKIVYEVRLNISPGSSCHCTEPGWFRVCFANMSEETLDLAMQRLKAFVTEYYNVPEVNGHGQNSRLNHSRRRSLTKWVFRLSFDDRSPIPGRWNLKDSLVWPPSRQILVKP